MTKSFGTLVLTALALGLPGAANAGNVVVFPDVAFKPVVASTSNGLGGAGFWDHRSYDSWTQSNGVGSACTAGAVIFGGACDWKGFSAPGPGDPYQQLSNALVGDPGSMKYLGKTDGSVPDAPDNFYFTGPWDLDVSVLFQLSAWDDAVEFGWYEAGNPNNRTSLLPKAGNPPGPYSDNDGTINPDGTVSADIPANFGFYYRNTRYGQTPDKEILFFTESMFNRVGGYFAFFSDLSAGQIGVLRQEFDDEMEFASLFDAIRRQQFALFTDASGRFWLGMEDQIGAITPAYCADRGLQPCADYDYNDLILSFETRDELDVPEPATLTMLGAGLLAAAWVRRRKR